MIVVAPDHPGTTSGDIDPFQTPLVWERIAAGEENICSDRGLRDRAVIHDELRGAILGFLQANLSLPG